MSADPDPLRLVLAHCDHLAQPRWVDDAFDFNNAKASHCFHCRERFIPFLQLGRSSKHHCRLCGELVCRSCSSKLHLPHKFEKKGKDLSRVCHGCLFLVLAKRVVGGETHPAVRFRVTQYVWGNVEPASMAEKIKLVPRVFFMPEWRSVHESSSCFKCAALTEKRHHCRLCGVLFCGDCSEKLSDVPQWYDKKNKPGGKRVCDYCRFCAARGWRFAQPGEANKQVKASEQTTGATKAIQPPTARSPPPTTTAARPMTAMGHPGPALPTSMRPAASASPALRPLSQCSVSTCSAAATIAGFCAAHDVDNSARPKNSPVTFDVLVRVRWEEDVLANHTAPWMQVSVVGHADLHAMHSRLVSAHPALDTADLQYVIRGRPVQKMHWRMFEARFCVPDIVIKKLAPFDHKRLTAAKIATPTPSGPPAAAIKVASPPPARAPSPPRISVLSPSSANLTREQLVAQSKPSRAVTISAKGEPSRAASPTMSPVHAVSPTMHATHTARAVPITSGPPPLRLAAAPPPPSSARPPLVSPPTQPPPHSRPGPPPVPKPTVTATGTAKKWPTVQC